MRADTGPAALLPAVAHAAMPAAAVALASWDLRSGVSLLACVVVSRNGTNTYSARSAPCPHSCLAAPAAAPPSPGRPSSAALGKRRLQPSAASMHASNRLCCAAAHHYHCSFIAACGYAAPCLPRTGGSVEPVEPNLNAPHRIRATDRQTWHRAAAARAAAAADPNPPDGSSTVAPHPPARRQRRGGGVGVNRTARQAD